MVGQMARAACTGDIMSYWDLSDLEVVRRCIDIIAERRLAYHEVNKQAEVRALDGAMNEVARAFGILADSPEMYSAKGDSDK